MNRNEFSELGTNWGQSRLRQGGSWLCEDDSDVVTIVEGKSSDSQECFRFSRLYLSQQDNWFGGVSRLELRNRVLHTCLLVSTVGRVAIARFLKESCVKGA